MRQLILTLPALCLTSLAACGSLEPAPSSTSLESQFGGLTETDEQPGFDDADVLAQGEDTPVTDTTGDDMRDARHVRIAVAWGYLRPHPDATETVDWTGSITADHAAIRVLRVLRFEENDAVVRPRTDRSVVEFESQTKPGADGLLLDVILAPALNPERAPVTLTFATGPYTDTLTLEPGMRMEKVVKVDEAGHVVAYHIIRPARDGECVEGFVRGLWQTKDDGEGRALGQLKGQIVDADGAVVGNLRGIFGVRKNGHQVWFAKVVDLEGKFLGVVVGKYGEGKLAGLFVGRGRKVIGAVHGAISDADGDGDGGFLGRYTERCGEATGEGQPSGSDEPEISLDDSTP